MQIVSGLILLIICAGMLFIARPPASSDGAPWLKRWFLGQIYVLTALVMVVVGVGLIVNGWPS